MNKVQFNKLEKGDFVIFKNDGESHIVVHKSNPMASNTAEITPCNSKYCGDLIRYVSREDIDPVDMKITFKDYVQYIEDKISHILFKSMWNNSYDRIIGDYGYSIIFFEDCNASGDYVYDYCIYRQSMKHKWLPSKCCFAYSDWKKEPCLMACNEYLDKIEKEWKTKHQE